jgi:hypothetical protein
LEKPVPRTVASKSKSVRTATKNALVESSAFEAVLDRILVNRLRPLRADVTAARKAFEEQVTLRVQAESHAARLEEETQRLRVRVADLEQQLEAASRQRTGWLRRRPVGRPQEA